MSMSRRRFLQLVGTVAAVTGLPQSAVAETLLASTDAARAAAELTTLAQRLGPGTATESGWRPIVTTGGEPHVVRDDFVAAQTGREGRRQSLVSFLHLTDQHIIDVQSTTRVEFLHRYADSDPEEQQTQCEGMFFASAHRPAEAACARVADAMLRRVREIQVSPVTGAPISAAVCTGDNTDNQAANELDVFLGVMNGGAVTPQSGDPDRYEGVQRSGIFDYWHPDSDEVDDRYKDLFGFPVSADFLDAALAPFEAVGAGMPWYSCYGNHDGLAQGNSPVTPAYQAVAEGPLKTTGLPPGSNPCVIGEGLEALSSPAAPAMEVTADPEGRTYVFRGEWIQGHLDAGGMNRGFTQANADEELAYYAADVGAVRWLVLDTVNPGGVADGSIGDAQLNWIDAELAAAQDEGKLVMLFSHHGLRSLTNPVDSPDPLRDPTYSDLPRHRADDVLEVIGKYTCVIAWVNGHTHNNIIETQQGVGDDPGQFWDIGTAAHVDWPAQARLVEVVDNDDGTLSIFTTIIDHADGDIVSFARECIGNDPQKGFGRGEGSAEDRNAELLLPHPFPAAAAPQPTPTPTEEPTPAPTTAPEPVAALPATGTPAGLTIGGALALAAAAGIKRLRERGTDAITSRETARR